VELQRSLDECKVDLQRLQTSHKEALDTNQDLIKQNSKAIEDLKLHHSQEISAKVAAETQLVEELDQASRKLESVNQNLEAGKARVEAVESQLNEQNRQLDSALSDRLELEAKVEAASDERHSLLERCLGAESELDRSRSTLVELRRKLDDSQAALQELGRENQSIQVDLARQSGRKWADDSEVNSCITCKTQFSLTNRKHHCRNCGQIFCKDCSTKKAQMEGFKNPQRVCDHCYAEIQQTK